MTTGPEHYTSAESWLFKAKHQSARGDGETPESCTALAQVHATLELAAATALSHGLDASSRFGWHQAAGEPPVSP